MKIKNKGKSAPIISSISFCHNVVRENNSKGDYIIVEFLDKEYKAQVINVDSKVDVNALDKKIEIKGVCDSDIVKIYDLYEQGGIINE